MNQDNDLQEGAGEKIALKPRGNFERYPHRSTYFIRGPDGIKIGQSGSPPVRMAALQCAHGTDLELLLTVPYGRLSEPDAHHMFRHLKLNGEWFRAEPELLYFIATLKKEQAKAVIPRAPVTVAKPQPAAEIKQLRSLAAKHGHSTPIGARYLMLALMIDRLPTYERPSWATHEMQTLPYKIKKTTEKIAELMADAN